MNYRKIIMSALLSVVSATSAMAGATLDHIKNDKSITIAYRETSVPFSYLGDNQKPVGFALELCQHVVERLESDFGTKLKVNMIPVNSSNRIPLIQNGSADIECGSTASSLTRLKQVQFSYSTFNTEAIWITLAKNGFKSDEDLKGKTVVGTQGSNVIPVIQKISKDKNLDLNIIQAKDHGESMLMLTTNRAVAFMEDNILLAGLRAQNSNPSQFAFLPEGYNPTYYALMMSKDDPEFKALVDDVLAGLMKSGEFEKIYNKWFMSPIPPKNINLDWPISKGLRERIETPSDFVDYY